MSAAYWLGWPFRWMHQAAHNGYGILRVVDICYLRPMRHGLIPLDHPWATGANPATGEPIWNENVVYRSPRGPGVPADEFVVGKTGQFLARRAAQSAGDVELPHGPARRMPHGINYIHGTSHYASGIVLFNDFADGLAHLTNKAFRAELYRFVREERREILFVFRERDYVPREFAYFACALRTLFPWFCNANGPRGRVLWGNAAPFATANLITGHWIADVLALRQPGGAEAVVRPPVKAGAYFRGANYATGRRHAAWPEKLLAWVTYFRVRLRGAKGGMFFVDRRTVYADQIDPATDEPLARM